MSDRLKQIEKLTRQLKESEQNLVMVGQRYKALADATFEAVFITIDDIIINMNKSASELFENVGDDYTGKSIIDLIYDEDKHIVQDYIKSNYEGNIELKAINANKEIIDVELQSKVTSIENNNNDKNKIYVHTIAIRDISGRKKTVHE